MTPEELSRIILRAIARDHAQRCQYSKRRLWSFYLDVKRSDKKRFEQWNITRELEEQLCEILRVKPRRTASGVATVSVITKPWPCAGECRYCPNDIRMPKSYLSREPACARAERVWFDPYLQALTRLSALNEMGHPTDKVELIVLGGTWSDYPYAYQCWFVRELFRALNDFDALSAAQIAIKSSAFCKRCLWYQQLELPCNADELAKLVAPEQDAILSGASTYNESWQRLYGQSLAWQSISERQKADLDAVFVEHKRNEVSAHRCVGLVFETRPDVVVPQNLTLMRRLGATKVQIGVQATDRGVLGRNSRRVNIEDVRRAFELLRLYGFKIHAHIMPNLLGSTPQKDMACYDSLFEGDSALYYRPDEIKLYPCVLVDGSNLAGDYATGEWKPYTKEELDRVLIHCVLKTPAYCRISRMIRDISVQDIVAGNKRANLRQDIDELLAHQKANIAEIRSREIVGRAVNFDELTCEDISYETTVSTEHFIQWVDKDYHIVGFLRLSLPRSCAHTSYSYLSVCVTHAMIREVHIYGSVSRLHERGSGAQHHGLGRALIDYACECAQRAGYKRINVISAVGTRDYYRAQGFFDNGLYLQKLLS